MLVLKFILTKLNVTDIFRETAPIFLIPPSFTRFEKPIRYSYTEKRYLMERSLPEISELDNIHSKIRSLRGTNVAPYVFSLTDDPPTEPNESTLRIKAFKEEITPSLKQEYEIVKKVLFSIHILIKFMEVFGVLRLRKHVEPSNLVRLQGCRGPMLVV